MSPAPCAGIAPVERLLAAARAEIGYREKASAADLDSKTGNPGSANYTKYARDLDALGDIYNGRKQGYDWCDVFVDWCFITVFGKELGMELLCQPYKGCGAGTKYSMGYYRARGRFHRADPRPGDQIFFGDASSVWHTGLVEKAEGGRVYTVEGNTGKGCVQVARCSYPLGEKTILGYGRPDWTLADRIPEPDGGGDGDMSYEQWKQYMEQYRKELQAREGSPWSESDRAWAAEAGLFQGGSEGGSMWQDFLTREQAAALFHREARRTGAA